MKLPRSLLGRVGLALFSAALAIWLLDLLVAAWDRHHQPARPHRGEAPVGDVDDRGDGGPWPAVPVPSSSLLDLHLRPVTGRVGLAHRLQSLPPDVAPVVEVLADGGVVLRRPPPLPASPLDPGAPARGGLGAAVLLPEGDLDALPARARGALLGVIGQLVDGRPVPEARLEVLDFPVSPGALRRLLSWLP